MQNAPEDSLDQPTTGAKGGAPPPSWASRLKLAAAEVFGLDTRSLALMRILLGIICISDVVIRYEDLGAFLTDAGALPRTAVIEELNRKEQISIYHASGGAFWPGLLLAVQGVTAFIFAIGWRTRVANIVLWFLVFSLHVRGSILLQSGDVILRLLLFWAMFLPMGAQLSVDSIRSWPVRPPPRLVAGFASLGLMVQLAVVYVFTAILKDGRPWHDGTAVYYAMKIDHFAKQPFAEIMLSQPWLMSLLTYGTYYWEIGGAFLLLLPFLRGPLRSFVVTSFIFMHIGFWAGLEIGLFPWICIAGWIGVYPGWFWDRLGWRLPEGGRAGGGVQVLGAGLSDSPALRRTGMILHNIVGAFFVYLVLNWNMSTLGIGGFSVPEGPRFVGHTLRLDQKWNMFAPYPLKDDGWFTIPGKLQGGKWVDLWQGGEVKWASESEVRSWNEGDEVKGRPDDWHQAVSRVKPELVSAMYPNQRWRKYMRNIWTKQYKDLRLYYGKHLCRSWNAEHSGPERLRTFEIYYMKETTGPPGQPDKPVEPVRIWKHDCFKNTQETDQ